MTADVDAAQEENPGAPVPIDLVTTSGSGLDPHIQPGGGAVPGAARRARARRAARTPFGSWSTAHTEGRQFGFLGEPVVNVLELNLALDERTPDEDDRRA